MSDLTGALRSALGHAQAVLPSLPPLSTERDHVEHLVRDITHALGIAETQAPYEAWGRYKAAVERQRQEHEASLARQSLNTGSSHLQTVTLCAVCKRPLGDNDDYITHARLGVDVCDACPKTDVCGEDITGHTVYFHRSRSRGAS